MSERSRKIKIAEPLERQCTKYDALFDLGKVTVIMSDRQLQDYSGYCHCIDVILDKKPQCAGDKIVVDTINLEGNRQTRAVYSCRLANRLNQAG